MSHSELSPLAMRKFVETLFTEISRETVSAILSKSGLPREWRDPEYFSTLDGAQSTQAYANLQLALRTYYGRGARGTLIRLGEKLWEPLLSDAPFAIRTQASLIRRLPKALKRKPALELLAGLLGVKRGDITVHSLDLDLLLVDRSSPATVEQKDDSPICYVTLGLIRECLYWATGEQHDIEERACRAVGAGQCEFKITIGV
ncbi:MAG: 4-vinyl reductase [Anaerolineales bacterium]|nr:4-vinyl reductase [Anaerolineales bacterium]